MCCQSIAKGILVTGSFHAKLISARPYASKSIVMLNLQPSQKWPYSKADDMASTKIKCNIGSFYNKVDKLSCHERCNIVHNV